MQYTGQIQDGQMHGKGTLVYPNSERYEVSMVSWCLCWGRRRSQEAGVSVSPTATLFVVTTSLRCSGRLGLRQAPRIRSLLLPRWWQVRGRGWCRRCVAAVLLASAIIAPGCSRRVRCCSGWMTRSTARASRGMPTGTFTRERWGRCARCTSRRLCSSRSVELLAVCLAVCLAVGIAVGQRSHQRLRRATVHRRRQVRPLRRALPTCPLRAHHAKSRRW
jgi:hypothetical protein